MNLLRPRVVIASCALLACAGCAAPVVATVAGGAVAADQTGAAQDFKTAFSEVDEQEEIAIGHEVAGRTLGAAHLVPDRTLQAYVNRVGHWVALHSDRPDLPWTFGVIEDRTVNAFAAPGGFILITRGLYQILDNEAQLAGVLGHEITHVVRRHHVDLLRKSSFLSGVTHLAQHQTRAEVLKSALGTGAEIFARGLDKRAEYQADREGVVLAARAGYSPQGLIEVLHKLEARGSHDDALKLLLDTHPAPADRLTKLGDAMKPRIATLPTGRQPKIHAIAAAVPARTSTSSTK